MPAALTPLADLNAPTRPVRIVVLPVGPGVVAPRPSRSRHVPPPWSGSMAALTAILLARPVPPAPVESTKRPCSPGVLVGSSASSDIRAIRSPASASSWAPTAGRSWSRSVKSAPKSPLETAPYEDVPGVMEMPSTVIPDRVPLAKVSPWEKAAVALNSMVRAVPSSRNTPSGVTTSIMP